jgi:hypothetical protein
MDEDTKFQTIMDKYQSCHLGLVNPQMAASLSQVNYIGSMQPKVISLHILINIYSTRCASMSSKLPVCKFHLDQNTWTWGTYVSPAASTVSQRLCNDHIWIKGLGSLDIRHRICTVAGTNTDNAIPPLLENRLAQAYKNFAT